MLRNWQYASLEPSPCLITSAIYPHPTLLVKPCTVRPLCSLLGKGTDKPIPPCVLFLSEVSTFRLNSFTNQRNEYLKAEFPSQIRITKLILQQENSKKFHVREGHKHRPTSKDGSVHMPSKYLCFLFGEPFFYFYDLPHVSSSLFAFLLYFIKASRRSEKS